MTYPMNVTGEKMKIQISLTQIERYDPCEEGWDILLEAKGKYEADDELFPVSDILEINGLDDTLWSLRCLPEYDNLWRKFAWWCANEVVSNASDPVLQQCLDTAWKYSEGQATDEELRLARASARCELKTPNYAVYYASHCEACKAVYYVALYAADAAELEDYAARKAVRNAQSIKLKEILDAGVFVK